MLQKQKYREGKIPAPSALSLPNLDPGGGVFVQIRGRDVTTAAR